MFERYTEPARRALFFARYEVGQLGSPEIASEHLLLGLVRDASVDRLLARAGISLESVRRDVEARCVLGEQRSDYGEVRFSGDAQRALRTAVDEADQLEHRDIGPEHLLLGLLREEGSLAAEILASRGVTYREVRRAIAGDAD